jgi:multidrug efflux pump subunit AcrA (membrane-fusion protein)
LTALTKVFIVLHVVMSLLLAAGLIVFVNRVDNYNTANKAQTQTIASLRAQLSSATTNAGLLQSDVALARQARDQAVADSQTKSAAQQLEIGRLQAQVAEGAKNLTMAQAATDNTTAALTASETAKKALSDLLESTRTDNNKMATANVQLNLAVADLTNRLEVAQRQVTNLNESVAELKTEKERLEKTIADAGLKVSNNPGVAGGAPPIDGVVRSTRTIGGIPYATISVGSQDQVKPGMKFSVIDREHSKFLGELTVEQVDEKEATGRLEGPGISEVHDEHAGPNPTEVKTQL